MKKEKFTKSLIGDRIVAGFIDYLIIYSFLFYCVYTLGIQSEDGSYHLEGLPALLPIAFWGIMTVGLEQWFGATSGNLLVGLRPVSIQESIDNTNSNTKLTFAQSFKRHLLDPIDMFFFGAVGIITIKNTEKHQRLGDLWGKTIVVNSKK